MKTIARAAMIVAILSGAIVSSEYNDMPGFSEKLGPGRTKNSISTVVAGIAMQKAYGTSEYELNLEKTGWSDAKIIGYTKPGLVESKVDLLFTSARFYGISNENKGLVGKVEKSEFDWKVEQTGNDSYHITRFGWKLDTDLILDLNDGVIKGRYVRPLAFDWDINGTYTRDGQVDISIDGPLTLGVNLSGKAIPKVSTVDVEKMVERYR